MQPIHQDILDNRYINKSAILIKSVYFQLRHEKVHLSTVILVCFWAGKSDLMIDDMSDCIYNNWSLITFFANFIRSSGFLALILMYSPIA